MSAPRTWADILALDEPALNLAIDKYCYQRALGPPSNHMGDWDSTMVLARRYHVWFLPDWPPWDFRHEQWTIYSASHEPPLRTTTETEMREAICRLALWEAVQQSKED